jgi:hypothetical protein
MDLLAEVVVKAPTTRLTLWPRAVLTIKCREIVGTIGTERTGHAGANQTLKWKRP